MIVLREVVLRREAPRALLLSLLMAAASQSACTTNHDALARQPKAGSSSGGSAGSAGFGGSFGNTGNQASEGGRNNPDYEPMGSNVLTIVNGVVDATSVRLCFAHVSDNGETADFVGSPLPELGYASSTVLTSLDGFSLSDDVIQPWVIAGDLSRIKKLDCAAAIDLAQNEEASVTPVAEALGSGGAASDGSAGAGGAETGEAGAPAMPKPPLEMPTLRARALPALPAGTVNIGRSILMVLTGCIGGAFYTDHVETAACGADYAPDAPTLQPIVVTLSRDLRFDKVGLQAVQASLPTGSVDVRASGDHEMVSLVFASSLAYGSIEPRPADTRFTPFELGVDQPNYGLQAIGDGGDVLYQAAWSEALAPSGITQMVAARTYTAIFLGPDPLLIKEGWWNKSAFAIVDNDPTRKD
jgi:hypothetical protein